MLVDLLFIQGCRVAEVKLPRPLLPPENCEVNFKVIGVRKAALMTYFEKGPATKSYVLNSWDESC
jgi:hypothetical protein